MSPVTNICTIRSSAGPGILSSLLARADTRTGPKEADGGCCPLKTEKPEPEPEVAIKRRKYPSQEPCGHQCKLIKQVRKIEQMLKYK